MNVNTDINGNSDEENFSGSGSESDESESENIDESNSSTSATATNGTDTTVNPPIQIITIDPVSDNTAAESEGIIEILHDTFFNNDNADRLNLSAADNIASTENSDTLSAPLASADESNNQTTSIETALGIEGADIEQTQTQDNTATNTANTTTTAVDSNGAEDDSIEPIFAGIPPLVDSRLCQRR